MSVFLKIITLGKTTRYQTRELLQEEVASQRSEVGFGYFKWEPHRNIRICGSYVCNSSGVQTLTWSPRLSEEAVETGSALLLDMNNQSFEATRKVVRGVAHSCTCQHLMWVWEACIWWVPGPPSSARFILCFHHCFLQKTSNTKFKLSLNFPGIRASTRFQNKCWSRADYLLQDC